MSLKHIAQFETGSLHFTTDSSGKKKSCIIFSTALFRVVTQRVMVFYFNFSVPTYRAPSSGLENPKIYGSLAPEDGTDISSRNVVNKLPLLPA